MDFKKINIDKLPKEIKEVFLDVKDMTDNFDSEVMSLMTEEISDLKSILIEYPEAIAPVKPKETKAKIVGRPTNMSQLKKWLKQNIGKSIYAVKAPNPKDIGTPRTISAVQTNSVMFMTKNGEAWLDYPKASNITFSKVGFEINDTLSYVYDKKDIPSQEPKKRNLSKSAQKTLARLKKQNKLKSQTENRKDSDIIRDAGRPAAKAGKRISKNGKVYYENRPNRTDVDPKGTMLKSGGSVKGGYIARFNGKKIEVEADSLYAAKLKAIKELKVPKSKQGYLSIISKKSDANQDFRFMKSGGTIAVGKKVRFKNGFGAIFTAEVVSVSVDRNGLKVFKYKNPKLEKPSDIDFGGKENELHSNVLLQSHVLKLGGQIEKISGNWNQNNLKNIAKISKKLGATSFIDFSSGGGYEHIYIHLPNKKVLSFDNVDEGISISNTPIESLKYESIPEEYAWLGYYPDVSIEDNYANVTEIVNAVKSGKYLKAYSDHQYKSGGNVNDSSKPDVLIKKWLSMDIENPGNEEENIVEYASVNKLNENAIWSSFEKATKGMSSNEKGQHAAALEPLIDDLSNDQAGFLFEDAWIVDPTLDETGREKVNPTKYYGEAFTNSELAHLYKTGGNVNENRSRDLKFQSKESWETSYAKRKNLKRRKYNKKKSKLSDGG